MRLLFSLFCEAAKVAPSGLMYILQGGYDRVKTSSLPLRIDHMFVVSRIAFQPEECGRPLTWSMRVVGQKGNVVSNELQIPMTIAHEEGCDCTFTSCFDFSGLMIYEPGDYFFVSLVDGNEIGRAHLSVLVSTEQTGEASADHS